MGDKAVLVLDADENQSKSLGDLLSKHAYRPIALSSLAQFERHAEGHECGVLIVNLDNVAVTNKILRDLKLKQPHLTIIALSGRQFHPELEEAIRDYISVCLARPVDADELIFWLKSVFKNNHASSA